MITGDKVTLKTGAVIDLSGKEGGETYLGGDERGEGKNGIQLAKETSLEKGSTINVSGKEKGGRAIVWGDIALIDGNINAQGSDIAKTGGFVETSGHYLSIGDNATTKTKEWLLDPENVTIEEESRSRDHNNSIETEFPTGEGTSSNPKKNNDTLSTLTNKTISKLLEGTQVLNITASKKLHVNSSINIGSNSHLILHSEGRSSQGVLIDGDITSNGGNLTIHSGGWVDVHKNITLGEGILNITAASVAFEGEQNKARSAADAKVVAQGTVTITGEKRDFRVSNISLNGTGGGLNITSVVGNLSHKFDGEINISGKVTVNQTSPSHHSAWQNSYISYWNVSKLNLEDGAEFTFIKFANSNKPSSLRQSHQGGGVLFQGAQGEMSFNLKEGARVNFKLKPNENTNTSKPLPIRFLANITATGKGSVFFDIYANHSGRGAELSMSEINISGGTNFTLNSHVRGDDAFKINKDLTINATNSDFSLRQTKDKFYDGYRRNAINSIYNISILGGNVTLGGQNSSSSITGNITIEKTANVTLEANNAPNQQNIKDRVIKLGSLLVNGRLSLTGENAHIAGNLTISEGANFKGNTKDNLNITGNFTNNGTAEINITQGAVNLGNITNDGSLNITTNAKNGQKSIINGNITNKKGNLNITNKGSNTEIQIGGNISQKEGNLTISSDKVNITNRITIKAGVDEESSGSSSSTKSNANLTIKTKTLELTNDLNISGFNKAEITAKNDSD
ncbi:adhesin, partial [Haemophilus influenzae]